MVKQGNQINITDPEFYYPRITQRSVVDLDALADMVQRNSSFSRGDFKGMITLLEDLIPTLLKDGRTVKLGNLGTFQLHAHTQSASTKEGVTWRNFLSLKPKCIPRFEVRLSEVSFTRVD